MSNIESKLRAKRLSNYEVAHIQVLTKRYNQRLRELEKQGYTKTSYAYMNLLGKQFKGAKYLTKDKQGRVKFRTDIVHMAKEEPDTLKRLSQELDSFGRGQSTTKRDILALHKKSAVTYLNKHNIPVNEKTIVRYLEAWTSVNEDMCTRLGSSAVADAFARIAVSDVPDSEITRILDEMDKADMSFIRLQKLLEKETNTDIYDKELQELYNIFK